MSYLGFLHYGGTGGGEGGVLPVFYRELVFEQIEPSEIVIDSKVNQVTISELSVVEITIDENEIGIGDL